MSIELRQAAQQALKALEAINDEMTVGEQYTNAGQYLLDALGPLRAALSRHPAQATQAEVTDAAIDAATRHIYHNGRPTSKEYRVGIARAILALRPERVPMIARSLAEWHEDDGYAVWWAWNGDLRGWAGEPAYIGSPLCDDWPGYHTHWTAHPTQPIGITAQAKKETP